MAETETLRARFDYSNTPAATPIRDIVNGAAAIQQADGLLFTRKLDGALRTTDLRPMSEQLVSGPLAVALAAIDPSSPVFQAAFSRIFEAWIAGLPVYSGTGPAPVPAGKAFLNNGTPQIAK